MNSIRVPALRIRQGENRQLFSTVLDGKLISVVADISRLNRSNDSLSLMGYQRPEVIKHVNEIKAYLESDNPMIPNSIVMACDTRVTFEPLFDGQDIGHLVIPLVEEGEKKAGLIVDGQQRTGALREAEIQGFNMSVCVFISDNVQEQREQFMLVNSVKPLSKQLLAELAPHTDARLPAALQTKKFVSLITQHLNFATGASAQHWPLRNKIKLCSNAEGFVSDTAVMKCLDASLRDGALYRFRDPQTGEGNKAAILATVNHFWSAVKLTFGEDWDKKPKDSRLLHGVGVHALFSLMDEIDAQYCILTDHNHASNQDTEVTPVSFFVSELERIRTVCRWSSGSWNFGIGKDGISKIRGWNEVQNVGVDIRLVTDFLVKCYREAVSDELEQHSA